MGLKGTVNWLTFSGYGVIDEVRQEEDWTRYELRPGPYAHNLFVEGESPSPEASFKRLVLAAGELPRALDIHGAVEDVCVYLSITGCHYESLRDELAERLRQIMVLTTDTVSLGEQ